ncbi:uncharacterized protein A4U43_C03F18540 [Asparagus officinalis]|uniref:Patatin n=1 Tax=Asparagus officinalis TaxID=4686 RepID=A0A5P1FC32_ASPOF|nr:uncharacterized protein A4U43_C03F18540 [Asparagus officinalis]
MASPMIIDQPRFITVLSIDGGGVRGIIPGKFLECLESHLQAKREVWKNPPLSDVCLATSAAPTYLPPHGFVTHDSEGKKHEFNLVDGGVAANNPTLATMNIIAKETLLTNEPSIKVPDPKNTSYLVISLGTGIRVEGDRSKFTAEAAAKWGVIGWMVQNNQPLIEVFQESSADLVDLHMTTLFNAIKAQNRFLRIQGNIPADAAELDNAKEENLKALEKVATELLEEEVSHKHEDSVITFLSAISVNIKKKTNKDVLYEFALLLSKEKKLRQASKAKK